MESPGTKSVRKIIGEICKIEVDILNIKANRLLHAS